jgi:hypothetical protein
MNLRKLLFAFALCLASSAAFGQGSTVTGNLTASVSTCAVGASPASCLFLPLGSTTSSAVATLGGTFSGTVQFEASGDNGSTWVSIASTPSAGGSTVTSATAVGSWQISAAGYTFLRIRCSTYASGTIVATLNPGRY